MTDGNHLFGDDQAPSKLSYVGEGKKYATIDELDSAYAHVNDHAGKLESENEDLRAKLEKFQSQDDAVAKVLDALKPKVQDADQDLADAHQGVKTEELENLVSTILDRSKANSQKQENNARVRNALKEQYGDKAEEVYTQKGKALGVDLDSLSETSPAAVLELFKSQGSQQSGQHSTFNSNALDSGAPRHGTHKYWQQMYADKKISREEKFRQQHKSAADMGQDYWN